MEPRLQANFQNVNEWLKFAEAKNAALVGANIAICLGLLQALPNIKDFLIWYSGYTVVLVVLLLISTAVALTSFLPETQLPYLAPIDSKSEEDNLVFFGHISKYKPDEYLAALNARENQPNVTLNLNDLDMAAQIVINSRIASRKYAYFTTALWFTLTALLTPLVTVPAFFIIKSRRKGNAA